MSENRKTPDPIDVFVGSRIRLRRNMLSMSQEKLGEQLGITFQQVQKYEKGANRVGASRLKAISRILEVPVSYFFDEDDTAGEVAYGFSEEPARYMDFISSAECVQLVRAFTNIHDPKVRRKIIDLAKTLADDDNKDL